MAVQGISHVAVGVSDMDRALQFYRDIIGLRVTKDHEEKAFGGGDPDAYHRRAVYLRQNDGPDAFFIVLDQQLQPEPHGKPPRIMQLGTHHFSFWVDNLVEIFEHAVEDGFRVIIGPTEADTDLYGEDAGQTILTAIVKDQDGNPVQLDQRL